MTIKINAADEMAFRRVVLANVRRAQQMMLPADARCIYDLACKHPGITSIVAAEKLDWSIKYTSAILGRLYFAGYLDRIRILPGTRGRYHFEYYNNVTGIKK